jgi:hypothetical protein
LKRGVAFDLPTAEERGVTGVMQIIGHLRLSASSHEHRTHSQQREHVNVRRTGKAEFHPSSPTGCRKILVWHNSTRKFFICFGLLAFWGRRKAAGERRTSRPNSHTRNGDRPLFSKLSSALIIRVLSISFAKLSRSLTCYSTHHQKSILLIVDCEMTRPFKETHTGNVRDTN